MKYKSARTLYNHIGQKYHDNRKNASNDVTELPTVLKLLGGLKGKQILDMGCGLGKHSKEFLKRGATVTGYDASEKMIQLTKSYCQNKGNFFRATHESVTFPLKSFDICVASFSLNYCKNLDDIFTKVTSWLREEGVFIFSIPHSLWLLDRTENMDYSKSHKIVIKMNSYDVEIFNYYHPLEDFIVEVNKNNLKLTNLVETTIPKRLKGWQEYKYRIPNALIFKVEKN